MLNLYNQILYYPLLNLLVFFYNLVPGNDLGVAIILLTILIKIILWPLFNQSIKSQKAMQQLQPKIQELNEKYKDKQDREKKAMAMMQLYEKEKINPLSSCFPLLIQLPILIAVYRVFIAGLAKGSLTAIYPFIYNPGVINTVSMGIFDLSKPSWVMAVLAGLAQFWQSKMMMGKNSKTTSSGNDSMAMAQSMTKQMVYFMPVLTVFIGISLPAGLTFYWFLITLLTALQQWYIIAKDQPKS